MVRIINFMSKNLLKYKIMEVISEVSPELGEIESREIAEKCTALLYDQLTTFFAREEARKMKLIKNRMRASKIKASKEFRGQVDTYALTLENIILDFCKEDK